MPDLRFLDNMLRGEWDRIREEWNRPSPLLTMMMREMREPQDHKPVTWRWRFPGRPAHPEEGSEIMAVTAVTSQTLTVRRFAGPVSVAWDWPIRSNGWYERRLREMGRV